MQARLKIDSIAEVGVGKALDVLAWEIELAGARCIFLDSLIGELTPDIPHDKRARLQAGLHAVDLLSQHLTSLSAFARQLSGDCPSEATAAVEPALATITLGGLAERMASAFGADEKLPAPGAPDAGDLDLF
ncbi:MAG: hypothetical protein AB1429_07885 [Pseudomonadota bacterium]